MLINLARTLVCFYMCFTVTTSYIYLKNSERTSKHQFSKTMSPYVENNNNLKKESRYPNFNKVITRINKLSVDEDVSNDGGYRIRHKGWSSRRPVTSTTTTTTPEPDLFETYGELENEDEFKDYEDSLIGDDDDLEYEDEDDSHFFDSIDEDIQAEEPTEKPTSTSKPRVVSKLTEYKWDHFGTREKVEDSMRKQLHITPSKEELKVKAFNEHYSRVNQQSKCSKPLPRVISVQQEHPDPTKIFTPSCTVLHRCAEDSGCCKRDTKCQYKVRVLVSLYFYANSVGQNQNTIEKLDFYNHTECECKERTEYIALENGSEPGEGSNSTIETSANGCNCPKPYQSFISTQKCNCDCDNDDQDCITLKKGKEHFSMTNRMCIQEDECNLPTCEYGAYNIDEGKCPTKQDKLENFRKFRFKNN